MAERVPHRRAGAEGRYPNGRQDGDPRDRPRHGDANRPALRLRRGRAQRTRCGRHPARFNLVITDDDGQHAVQVRNGVLHY